MTAPTEPGFARHKKGVLESSSHNIGEGDFHLPKEVEEGNVEYKRTLVHPTPQRLDHLTSQLKWRLREGNGEALYELGIDDDGSPRGLSDDDITRSIANLKIMASRLQATVSVVCERNAKEGRVVELLVREQREDSYVDVRIAVCGNVDAGKSTLVGVLASGELDNGRGRSRLHCFNHRHEIETGRTSSVGEQILGFDAEGECVNYSELHRMSWGDIIERARKIVSFLDLAGHEKYLRTTVAGMTGSLPDYAMLVVGANMGVTHMAKEHLGLCVALKIPVIVVLTKVDICPENVKKDSLAAIAQLFKNRGLRKNLFPIRSDVDVVSAVKGDTLEKVVPIFEVSSVTGLNLDLLRTFLNLVPPRVQWAQMFDKPAEVLIDRVWQVDNVGTVVGGTVMAGQVTVGQSLLLGPDLKGHFTSVTVKSIHVKRVNVKSANAGQSAGFALKRVKKTQVRPGMVLCAPEAMPRAYATWTFEADVVVLHHNTTIAAKSESLSLEVVLHPNTTSTANYEPCVQCLAVRQTAKVISIQHSDEVLRAGDRARVTFKFKFQPEYLKPGMRLIFRDGKCKGIGIVASVANDILIGSGSGTSTPLSMSGGHAQGESEGLDKSGEFSRTTFVSV